MKSLTIQQMYDYAKLSVLAYVDLIKYLSINSYDLVQDNHSGRQGVECNVREVRLLVSW